jgi:tetratricopeptide (TPR) repeat protein
MEVVDGLAALLDKNLLRQIEVAESEPRFVMFETIHEYALERLVERGEIEAMRRQHAAYYLALVAAAEPLLRGPQQNPSLNRLAIEHDNLRAVLAWAQEYDAEMGLRLAASLWWFWDLRGYYSEGRSWLARLLARPETLERTLVRAKALHGAAMLAAKQRDLVMARAMGEECLMLLRALDDNQYLARPLVTLARTLAIQGDLAAASTFAEEALTLAQQLGDQSQIALALSCRGNIAWRQGDYDQAVSRLEASVKLWQELGDTWGLAWSLLNLGWVALAQGDITQALAACRRERFPGHLTALCSTTHNPIVIRYSYLSPTNC